VVSGFKNKRKWLITANCLSLYTIVIVIIIIIIIYKTTSLWFFVLRLMKLIFVHKRKNIFLSFVIFLSFLIIKKMLEII
jgi:hypothetical protein